MYKVYTPDIKSIYLFLLETKCFRSMFNAISNYFFYLDKNQRSIIPKTDEISF